MTTLDEDKKRFNKATELLNNGDYNDALDVLSQLDQSPDVLNDRAVALHQLGRTREAVDTLNEAVNADPGNVPAILNRRYMKLAREAARQSPVRDVLFDSGPLEKSEFDVSVIIPTYDRPDFLHETVKSVLDQTFTDFELIIVNDGGPDKAAEIVKNTGSEKVRYIRIEHGGISAALNAGVRHAVGKYIAYLDDDDAYLPKHLETLAGYLDSHPEAKFAYTFSYRTIQHEINGEWKTVEKHLVNVYPYDRDKLVSSNLIQTTGSIMHRRELVEEIGGFNENIIGSQDWEWYLRVSEKYPLHYIEIPTVDHYIRAQPGSQVSGNPSVMRTNNITVRYMHKLLVLTSDVPGRRGYQRALKCIGKLFEKWPETIDILDVKELANRKPYACLFRLGKDLSIMGEKEKARAAFLEALKIAPWEIKVYPKLVFP